MAATTFQEAYGVLTIAEWRAIKKNNVSPSDYDDLCDEFGQENHAEITRAITERSRGAGYYRHNPYLANLSRQRGILA